MNKKVYVHKVHSDERPRRGEREFREHRHHGESDGRPFRHFHEENIQKPFGRKIRRHFPKPKTKMFTSKEELVNYVNSIGEAGHKIDIYKIDEDLYKIVVFEEPSIDELDEEVEVEVEIK